MNDLKIIYEDNHLIVVIKKPNIPVQLDESNDLDLQSIIKEYLKTKYNKTGNVYLGIVHRLDRPVGGIMVFAKTSKAASRLSKNIQNHEFKKEYLAVIRGNIPNSGTLKNYLARKDKKAYVTTADKGKYAELSYKVIAKKEDLNLLKIDLKTGRHHQIRVQFQNIGFPLFGDQFYGEKNKEQIALFAYKLSFNHPVTKELLTFKALPDYGVFTEFNMEEL